MFILQRRNKAFVGPAGILFVHQNGSNEVVSWGEIRSAVYNGFGGGAKLLSSDGKNVKTIEYEFFGADKPTREFIDKVNEWEPKCPASIKEVSHR